MNEAGKIVAVSFKLRHALNEIGKQNESPSSIAGDIVSSLMYLRNQGPEYAGDYIHMLKAVTNAVARGQKEYVKKHLIDILVIENQFEIIENIQLK